MPQKERKKARKPTEFENRKPQVSLFPIKTSAALCKAEHTEPDRELSADQQNTGKQQLPRISYEK